MAHMKSIHCIRTSLTKRSVVRAEAGVIVNDII